MKKIVVTSVSFCRSATLCRQLEESLPPGYELDFARAQQPLTGDALVAATDGAEIVLAGTEKFSRTVLEHLPHLRCIAKYGVGLDGIDLGFCRERGILVYREEGTNAMPVAELTIGLCISLMRNIHLTATRLKGGEWFKNGGQGLQGKTVAVVGCGHVGSRVARLFRALGAGLLLVDILDKGALCSELGGEAVPFHEAVVRADVLTLHVPLTPRTRTMVDGACLRSMKSTAILINTARGEVICQDSLKQALQDGGIAGAALDVFDGEPSPDTELVRLPNFIGTPHIAGNSEQAVRAMGQAAIRGVLEYARTGTVPDVASVDP